MEADLKGYVVGVGAPDLRVPQDVSIPAGSSGLLGLVVISPGIPPLANTPYDLAGATVTETISDSLGNIVLSLTMALGSPTSAGAASVALAPNNTASLAPLNFNSIIYKHIVTVTGGALSSYPIFPSSRFIITPSLGSTPVPSQPSAFGLQPVMVSTAYSARLVDFVAADPTLGSFAVTLPPAASATQNQNVVIVRNDSTSANVIVVTPSGSDTIAGFATWTLDAGESLSLMARAGVWMPW